MYIVLKSTYSSNIYDSMEDGTFYGIFNKRSDAIFYACSLRNRLRKNSIKYLRPKELKYYYKTPDLNARTTFDRFYMDEMLQIAVYRNTVIEISIREKVDNNGFEDTYDYSYLVIEVEPK